MKCVFICSVPISHIIPIQPIIEYFNERNIGVSVISNKQNKQRIENYGAKFIEYPFNFLGNNNSDLLYERSLKFNEYIMKEEYSKAFDYFIKKDTEYFYDHSFENLKLLFNVIKNEKPDFIIRDAVDRYGNVIAKLLNIPCIGIITHCLYSKKYFESNPSYLYKVFMDALKFNSKKLDKYFTTFRENSELIHESVYMDSETFRINTFHQFDPCEELTLINSIKTLQPKSSFEANRKYLLIYPNLKRFEIESNVDKFLENFIENAKHKEKKIVYIATGSMISFKYEFCIKLIDNLLKNNLCVIMSNNTDYKVLRDYYDKQKELVYIDKFIPQQFALKNSDLFISSAGQNSIIEAIYHKIPILAMPLTSEQKLNGLLIEDSGIGLTTYINRDRYITYGSLVKSLLFESKYKENLDILNNDLIHGKNNFDVILDYVKERQEQISNFYIIR